MPYVSGQNRLEFNHAIARYHTGAITRKQCLEAIDAALPQEEKKITRKHRGGYDRSLESAEPEELEE